jgi:Na+-transporting NADH:ubiquinone oxidoreductase subunit NqrB
VPAIRRSFGILQPTLPMLAMIVGFSFFVFLAMEVIKAIMRKRMSPAWRGPAAAE